MAAPVPVVTIGSASSTTGSTVTGTSTSPLPGGPTVSVDGGQLTFVSKGGTGTNAGYSLGTLPGGVEVSTGGVESPIVTIGSAGSSTGSTVTSTSTSPLPGGPTGGGPVLVLSGASNGMTTTGSSPGALPGAVEFGSNAATMPVMTVEGGGTSTGSTVASSSMSPLPQRFDVLYGGTPVQFVSGASNLTTNTGYSIGGLPGTIEVGAAASQLPVVTAEAAGSTSTTSSSDCELFDEFRYRSVSRRALPMHRCRW